ncbi:MAG TPA: hypothetical protein VFZ27_17905 [Terriglobia bacterium]|nr:hypothetical protein [Terriglobia bacterium]
MNKASLGHFLSRKKTSAGKLRSFRAPAKRKIALPATVFEFQPEYLLGARIFRSFRRVASVAVGALDAGALTPHLGRPNVAKLDEVARKARGVASALGTERGPFGLLLPDAAVRVSILEFQTLPADHKEQASLVRWKMKPLLPFPLEEARISFEVAPGESGGVEAVVMAVRKSVLAEYESILDSLNGDVNLVLPASAALLPLLNENAEGGEMLLNVSPSYLTVVVAKAGQIRLWRNKALHGKSEEEGLAAVAEEAMRSLAASVDHLKIEISRVCVSARPALSRTWVTDLEKKLGRKIGSVVSPGLPLRMKLTSEEVQIFNEFGATVSGLLVNAA